MRNAVVKKFIFSLAALSTLSYSLNMQAMDQNNQAEMQKAFVTFVGAGCTIYLIEKAGDALELSESIKKGLDLTILLASVGFVAKNNELKEGAWRVPVALATHQLVSTERAMK